MTQNYENYWKLTLEYTDINSEAFIGTLRLIVDFINDHSGAYTPNLYRELQNSVNIVFPKSDKGSVRKSINQFVKLGFISFELQSYHPETLKFLDAETNRKRKDIFSKIIYSNARFNSSVTNNSEVKEINFLLKTLEEVGKLSKEDIIGLMTVDILTFEQDFLTKDEVQYAKKKAEEDGFIERKYNQVSYLWTLLKKLDDLIIVDNYLYFEEDIDVEKTKIKTQKRDNYLHRVYKNELQNEVECALSEKQCMVERLAYPSLVASHIKPFIEGYRDDDDSCYDPDNGLLLSRNIDILFDQGWISFKDDGTIVISSELPINVISSLSSYNLPKIFLNDRRRNYLEFHRNYFDSKLSA